MLYDRLRIIVFDRERVFDRADTVARSRLAALLEPLGARYAGWQGHCYGLTNPTHLFMLDSPTDEQIARLLMFAQSSEKRHNVLLKVLREFKGSASQEYSVEHIMRNIATILAPMMLAEERDSSVVARTWSDLRVMQEMINSAPTE